LFAVEFLKKLLQSALSGTLKDFEKLHIRCMPAIK
jgi:hypothetical protein